MSSSSFFVDLIEWFEKFVFDFNSLYRAVVQPLGEWSAEVFGSSFSLLWLISIGGLVSFLGVAIAKWIIS